MKKLFLLLLTGSIAFGASAQYRQASVVSVPAELGNMPHGKVLTKAQMLNAHPELNNSQGAAHKTTSGGSRWYNYPIQYVDTISKIASAGTNYMAWSSVSEWSDTNMIAQYSATVARHVTLVSIGDVFDPNAASFNDSTYFTGLLKVTSGNAYTVDSIVLSGRYNFNPAKTTIVDTVRLSFVKGHGGSFASDDVFGGGGFSGSGGHYGSITFYDMHYDSVKNYARHGTSYGTASDDVYDMILTTSDWGDTAANGMYSKAIQLPTALSVTAGGVAGVSISFISGDATAPTSAVPGDTLLRANGSYKYNAFEPAIWFVSDGTNTQWAPFIAGDHNTGYYKEQPTWENGWSGTFLPQYGYESAGASGGAYFWQYPDVSWHVNCSSCGLITNTSAVKNVSNINKVEAYPNPTSGELNVPFTLTQNAHVTVSLTNMIGQVVASQDMGNVNSGKAVINTATLPEGVYFYTVNANSERSTGRVVVAH